MMLDLLRPLRTNDGRPVRLDKVSAGGTVLVWIDGDPHRRAFAKSGARCFPAPGETLRIENVPGDVPK